MRLHCNIYWFIGSKVIILPISADFCAMIIFMPTQLRSCGTLGVRVAGCCAGCQDWCSALSTCIRWPKWLHSALRLHNALCLLPCTVVIHYPLLHSLVHFNICSDKLHQRLVRSFIFPRRLKLSIMRMKQHHCLHPPPVLSLTGCELSHVCLNQHWGEAPARRAAGTLTETISFCQ